MYKHIIESNFPIRCVCVAKSFHSFKGEHLLDVHSVPDIESSSVHTERSDEMLPLQPLIAYWKQLTRIWKVAKQ